MKKAVLCNPDLTANEFAQYFIKKINQAHNFKRDANEWIFKATGTADFLYGNEKMVNFEHIRKCLKKGIRVELSMMDRSAVIKQTDQDTARLRTISYDFSQEKIKSKNAYDHDKMKFSENSWDKMKAFSLWDLNRPIKVKIKGVDNIHITKKLNKTISEPYDQMLYVSAKCYHGGTSISLRRYSKAVPFSKDPRWYQYMAFPDLLMSDMPREIRICFTLYSKKYDEEELNSGKPVIPGKKDYPVAWVNFTCIDHKGVLKTGKYSIGMWPDEKGKPTGTTVQNKASERRQPPSLQIELDSYALPVVFPDRGTLPKRMEKSYEAFEYRQKKEYPPIDREGLTEELDRLIETDPLYVLSDEEKWRIWENREKLKDNPRALPKFLKSVNWSYPSAVREAHKYLDLWKPIQPIDSLELLDYNYADARVRTYALKILNGLKDSRLVDFILQLVQTLKYEASHDTSLARFLLERGIRSTHLIGHVLFWHLKAEMHVTEIRERHGLILQEYLSTCGGHRRELLKQNGVVDQLLAIALLIKKTKKADQVTVLRREVRKLTLPPKFKLPLNPRMEVKGIIPEKCKVMDSKKLPLWLVFKNADSSGSGVYIIFKAGDDLRQDLLTLQVLKIMDGLWRERGLDLHIQAYGCVSTGDGVGMIEVVLNSDTIANITAARGGASAALVSKDPLQVWLKENNPKKEDWDQVVESFVLSCAGYCCATYVLGIGDRHNDNIMLTRKGDLFHIDFGHFLGHFKVFAGIYQRETTPFVFTPMYAFVMGGPESKAYKAFANLGCRAFNIVREHGHLLMNLFILMLATGIPELVGTEDIMWLRKCLVLHKTPKQANAHFQGLIKESLGNQRARINDYVHILAHKK